MFPGSQPANATFIRIQTSANGIAEAAFLTGGTPGVFLVEAAVEDTEASATFALTNIPGLPAPALSPEAARMQAAADVLGGALEDENVGLHGPFLLPAGTQFYSHGPWTATDRSQPVVTDSLAWFFWVDDSPQAAFAHSTRFVLMDASDDSGDAGSAAVINPDQWWPEVVLPGASEIFQLVPPYSGHEGIAIAAVAAAPLRPEPVLGDAPSDACAIAIYGPNLGQARQDSEEFRDYLLNNDLVAADNIFMNLQDFGGAPFNRSSSRQDIQRIIDRAKAKDCKKMYFFLRTHGASKSSSNGGGVSVRQQTDADSGHLSYEDLIEMLTPFKGAELCVILDSCYSGQLALWIQGHGFTGTIITSSDADHVSYYLDSTGGILWTAFSAALENDDADANGDDKVSFREALDFALLQNPNDSGLNDPMPLGAPISAEGTRQMRADNVMIYAKGSRRLIKVRRPKAANANSTFTAEVRSLQPSVADLGSDPVTVTLPPGTECVNAPIVGRSCNVTQYVINGTDVTGQKYIGSATVQVNDIRLSEETITLAPGEIKRITVTRYGEHFDDGSATTIEVESNDNTVAVPGILVPIPVPGGQATQEISIHGRGPGMTSFFIVDKASGGIKSLKVIVPGVPEPGETGCGVDGSSEVSLGVDTTQGDPSHDGPTGTLRDGTLNWFSTPEQFQIIGSRSQLVTATGTLNIVDCTFTAEGTATSPIAGFNNAKARYTGKFTGSDFSKIEFKYELGTNGVFPGGGAIFYDGVGDVNQPSSDVGLEPSDAQIPSAGGSGVFGVGVSPGTQWSALTAAEWMTLTSPAQGMGVGAVHFDVQPNNGPQDRIGTIIVTPNGVNKMSTGLAFGDDGSTTFTVFQSGNDPARPSILPFGVINGASFLTGITENGWFTIAGSNLSMTTRTWAAEDFQGDTLPTALDGVRILVNGVPAAVAFVSPRQLNGLAQMDPTVTEVEVVVETPWGVSDPETVFKRSAEPDFFRFSPGEGRYVAAVHLDGVFVGSPDLFQTFETRAASPGDFIAAYGGGFGETDPPTSPDRLVSAPAALANPVVFRIGGRNASVLFSGLVGPGLYQFNVEIPHLPPGDYLFEAFQNGQPIQSPVYITIGE